MLFLITCYKYLFIPLDENNIAVEIVFENQLVKEILEKYRLIWAIGHASSLMGWDSETYMPMEGVKDRAVARAELSLLHQQLILKPEFVELVERAGRQEGLNDFEKGVVRVLQREIKIMKALPPWLVAELSKTTQEAMVVWREAKSKNDFNMFKPYLEKIFDLSRKAADYIGWEKHPYDALLDMYEEGLRTSDVLNLFGSLKPSLKQLIVKVISAGKYPREHELEKIPYETSKMEIVNKKILEFFNFPLGKRARLDVSAHPFTIDTGIHDVRITTRYEGVDFKRTLFSVIHEYGHALYQLQIDPALSYTPIGSGVSLGVHEGQSRFWENIVGRSTAFTEFIYPVLRENLDFVRKYTPEEIYFYFNTVRPSLIRVDADEVTYNMHILLRAELEMLVLNNEVKVDELPELWNSKIDELLGIKPKTYAEGVLQDIHWSMGSIGYFPTYTLGNLLSAQMRYAMNRDINLDETVRSGEFNRIQEWQREKLHKWGATYPPKQLLEKMLGESYNSEYLVKYLSEKYLS
ncbi:carboxypeptidase Pfu [Thermosphaera aggregans DSM 11486]|jgi:carboxypeptidase Taq|uniref:Metal-dependent carboxypeptidase n=1 Tax=Thermosphaera aggregans (strain DSM 11486 / M11TL) TaxID=633148 RepID=D5U0T1_THEAM|nr:carboxypeptidase Pfu [Thermosphaera aggregans DSM 11486]